MYFGLGTAFKAHRLCLQDRWIDHNDPQLQYVPASHARLLQEFHFLASAQCSKDDAKLNAQHILQKASSCPLFSLTKRQISAEPGPGAFKPRGCQGRCPIFPAGVLLVGVECGYCLDTGQVDAKLAG